MRFVCISDTHMRHFRKLDLPEGDVLIHAGDLCLNGDMAELQSAVDYIMAAVERSKFRHVIFIAGNHDFAFEREPLAANMVMTKAGIIYLQDREVVIDGFKIYGSPWSLTFMQWAFMKERGPEIRKMWDKIPQDTNVLVTHTPPNGILDKTVIWNDMAGCEELKQVVSELPDLQLHIFGHIHEGYGHMIWPYIPEDKSVHYVNASRCNAAYSPINEPIVVDLDAPKRKE